MARRHEYVSFFSDGRRRGREFAGFESRVGPSRLILPALAIAFLGVSVYWFAWRTPEAGGVLTLEDATIPTLLLPAGAATDDASLLLSGVSLDCHTEVTDWPTFQGGMERAGCVTAPTITTPRIMWRRPAPIGVSGWLNSPIVVQNTIYVGSAGVGQGQQDRRDGVYALDLLTGEQKWFFGASLDVNGISYGSGMIIATGDEGRVWGIEAADGSLVWEDDLGVATFGSPLIVGEMVVIGDGAGNVRTFDVKSGRRGWSRAVDGPIRGGASSDGEIIVVAGENRDVLAVDLKGELLWRIKLTARGPAGDLARIWAAPTFAGDLVVFTLLRDDLFAEPAIAALDKHTGEIVWRAIDVAGIKPTDWGNIRSSVAWVGDYLIYAEAYSNELIALDVETGETVWGIEAGAFCYPHWPSPAVVSGQVIVPRHDGGLYGISVADEKVVWSIFLGSLENSLAGTFPQGFDATFCEWGPENTASILASPAVAPNGYIIVGTLEGYIVAIGDRSWG